MATSEERLKILKMIQEGKITAEDGMRLIDALDSSQSSAERRPAKNGGAVGTHWLRVRVTDLSTGKSKVNVRLPVNLVNAGMKMGARFSPEVNGLDMTQVMQRIDAGETGKIVDVVDDQEGEHVEVFIE
jgi:hypothetical protein